MIYLAAKINFSNFLFSVTGMTESSTITFQTNPWQVDDIANFSYFCCPECIFKTKTVPDFQVHAIVNHPDAKDFFERYGDRYWEEHR